MVRLRIALLALSVLLGLPSAAFARTCSVESAFAKPVPVTMHGYDGDVMEPFLTPDGKTLLFNNRNDHPKTNTNIFFAEKIDATNFRFRGELPGVNSEALDGVPSVTASGEIYFISTRAYEKTLSTIYRGQLKPGGVPTVTPVDGLASPRFGNLFFDVDVRADGKMMVYADGVFTGNPYPDTALLQVAVPTARGYSKASDSEKIMEHINTGIRQYAAAISADGQELFFTRLEKFFLIPEMDIYHATWNAASGQFNPPKRLDAIKGVLIEAATPTPDGCGLYYHEMKDDRYVLSYITRRPD